MNKDFYKATLSSVRHSDELTERIMDMTTEKKTRNNHPMYKRLAAAVFALVLFIGGGIGINHIIPTSNTNHIPDTSTIQQTNTLGILIAYANDEIIYADEVQYNIGSENEQKLFYRIYVAPFSLSDDEQARIKQEYTSQKEELLEQSDKVAKNGYGTSVHSSSWAFYSPKLDKETAMGYLLNASSFSLDLNDYTEIKEININNKSQYGKIDLLYIVNDEGKEEWEHGHSVNISGEALRFSKNTERLASGIGNKEVNNGYRIFWNMDEYLYDVIGDNPNFDLSQIKDTITFTVTFNDGNVKTASLNLHFDKDGYMHFE